MSKVVDITEKLNFEKRPQIVIKGVTLEVNDRAADVLKIMQIHADGKNDPTSLLKMYEVLFSKKDRDKIDTFQLGLNDFTQVIMAAANIATGGGDEGEGQTRITT